MKTLFPFCFFLFFFSFANSQASTPFPDSNAVWSSSYYSCYNLDQSATGYLARDRNYIYINGDTTIGGRTYSLIFEQQINIAGTCGGLPLYTETITHIDTISNLIIGFLRQDTTTRKVYWLGCGFTTETILYDFNLSVGDTVNRFFQTANCDYDSARVLSIDTFISDKPYKRFNFDMVDTGFGYHLRTSWIEGIGSGQGLLYNLNCGYQLDCFSRNDSVIYPSFHNGACAILTSTPEIKQQQTTLRLSPNPTTNICTMQWNTPGTFSATLFDITGREIIPLFTQQNISSFNINTTPLPPGLYFIKLTDNKGQFAVSKLVRE